MNPGSPSNIESSARDRRTQREFPKRVLLILAAVSGVLALISHPARDRAYSTVVDWSANSGLEAAVGFVAEKGLLALVALTCVLATWCFLRSRRRFWTLVSAGVGVIAAYALSEGVKVLVAQPRPCTVMDLTTVLACPGPGDWSWPSNHSVLAAAFAAACVLAAARSVWIAVPVALVIAGSRVAAGVHYVHDVLSGLALGVLVVTGVVFALRHVIDRALDSGQNGRASLEVRS